MLQFEAFRFVSFSSPSNTRMLTSFGRLLGSALHTLEDLTAHSNWCELALRKLGHEEVFCHVGDASKLGCPLASG